MPGTLVKPPSPSIATPVPDDEDAERMHKYITDRRVIGVRPNPKLSRLLALKASSSPSRFLPRKPLLPTSLHHVPLEPFPHVQYDPLIQPALIRHEITSTPEAQSTIARARWTASRINAGEDDRLLVIVGPCSIHSPEQAIEYAKLLKEDMPAWDGLHIVMRAYL